MSNSKKLLQSASGYIDQTSGGTDVKNVFNMIQWTGSNGYSKNFADNYYSGFNIYGGAGTSDPKSGAMILKNTKQQESAEIYYNSSSGSSSTRALTLDNDTTTATSEQQSPNLTFSGGGYSTSNYFRNSSNGQYQSYFFKKHSGFFTTVNWTGNGQSTQQISHDLGGEVGMMWVKNRYGGSSNPILVYHRGIDDNPTHTPARKSEDFYLKMSDVGALSSSGVYYGNGGSAVSWGGTKPTSTHFTVGGTSGDDALNANGAEYVAHIWGHDDSDTSIIKNIGYMGSSGDKKVTLGFTPQFLLIKRVDGSGDWFVLDKLQGLHNKDASNTYGAWYWKLNKHDAQAKTQGNFQAEFHADGFTIKTVDNATNNNFYGNSYIVMAIAKDNTSPDKTFGGQSGTVSISDLAKRQHYFKPVTRTGTGGSNSEQYIDMIPDMWLTKKRPTGDYWIMRDRMTYPWARGNFMASTSNYVNASTFGKSNWHFFNSNQEHYSAASSGTRVSRNVTVRNSDSAWNQYYVGYLDLYFTHAPSFLNSIMYRGDNGTNHAVKHGLLAVPEMVWIIPLDQYYPTMVWHKDMGQGTSVASNNLFVDFDNGSNFERTQQTNIFGSSTPTDTLFYVNSTYKPDANTGSIINKLDNRYILISFASCSGLSSVGSFTMSGGNDTTVDCGFGSNQPRFVMVKNVADYESGKPSAGRGFYVWDSARGINGSGSTDPIFQFDNPNHNEQSDTADIIDPTSGGFTVKDSGAVNTGIYDGFYIYWAIC